MNLNSARNGLFAHITWCLAIWACAEKKGHRVSLRAVSPQYGKSDASVDWFDAMFLNRRPALNGDRKARVSLAEYEEWPGYQTKAGSTDRSRANALFRKFSGVQPDLIAEVDQFCTEQWDSDPVLGVHYRGTDKAVEAPPVSTEAMINYIREALLLWPELKTVFIATDEDNFPEAVRLAFPNHRITFVDDALRSRNGCAVHHLNQANGLKRAREAVFDCLVLSKTSLLIKTSSMLSGWSAILSPALPVILVNPPHPHANFFPDCILNDRIGDLPARIATARSTYLATSISR